MNQAVVFVVGLALVSAPSAVASDLSAPSVPTVSVTLPPVPTVSVTLPPVPTVSVPVPVPSLPPAPTVAAPPVVAHQLPVVSAPSGSALNASAPAGATTTPSSHSVSRAAPLGSGGRPAPTSSARSGRTGAASGRSASSRATARSRSATAAAARPAAHRRAVRRERRLRRVVGRLRGCLDGLPVLERRVLVLRAGVGPGGPRSRARVARGTNLSTRRVARLERRGLRRLRDLARGGCGMSASSDDPVAIVRVSAPTVPGFARALVAAATFAGGDPGHIEVKGEQESSTPSGGAGTTPELASPAADTNGLAPPGAVMKLPKDPGFPLVAVFVLLAVVLVGFVLEARRSVRPR
jgi:hypothetical protein